MKVQFFGATKTVTGSCFLFSANGSNILIDCGLFQEDEKEFLNYEPFPFNPRKIDLMILTHAHLDHSALVPKLFKEGYRGKILTTPATKDLLGIMLFDALKVQKNEQYKQPLYDEDNINRALRQTETLSYGKELKFNGMTIRFFDAGHILGSATVELNVNGKTVVFSGDLGRTGYPILRDPVPPQKADYLILESTYGNRLHKSLAQSIDELLQAIKDTFKRGGNVVIPAFAVGRTQDLLYILNRSVRQGLIEPLDVYLDSPLAEEATRIYISHPEVFDDEALNELRNHKKTAIKLHFVKSVEESKKLNQIKSGAVIIAGSGMCQGGRVIYHLYHNIDREECSVIIVGFQAKGTLGRKIVDGEKSVPILGKMIPVKAKIYTIGGFSAHADQQELHQWLGSIDSKPKVFLIHGEESVIENFKQSIEEKFGLNCTVPERMEIHEIV
ncbi:MBL fold metallo-hydrolase [Thermodesulfovibrio sp.]|jgi:metallo-beta-lactamase family protein|uniref:MBL fold metallo-hydrolase RNA specificity domain-containing protein n=1 Tax=Thermodesulfovibrio TaxID=28261 RepID=UPI00260B2DC1|nr:MBL fold metallo-hydrolase [Thermodesulfovibrio sp.]